MRRRQKEERKKTQEVGRLSPAVATVADTVCPYLTDF